MLTELNIPDFDSVFDRFTCRFHRQILLYNDVVQHFVRLHLL